jgi:hypothetical protein
VPLARQPLPLADGSVARGPATTPQLAYDVRQTGDRLELRVRALASTMSADVLEQGRERPAPRTRLRAAARVLAALAVVTTGALQGRGDEAAPGPPPEQPRPGCCSSGPRSCRCATRWRGGCTSASASRGGSRPLLAVTVDLPGNDLALLPSPDR